MRAVRARSNGRQQRGKIQDLIHVLDLAPQQLIVNSPNVRYAVTVVAVKINLAEEFFYLLLPFQLFKLFPLQIKTHRVEFCQPLRCDRTNIAGKRISGKQRVEKRPRQQCSQSLLMKLTPRW